jgi:hypothetical protein
MLVRATLPPNAKVIVVSKGAEEMLRLDVQRAWHFPQNGEGVYAGYYPADSAEAVAHLEELREKGAGFLLFPVTSLWWLEHYPKFKQHLDAHYQLIWSGEPCTIYRLSEPVAEDVEDRA